MKPVHIALAALVVLLSLTGQGLVKLALNDARAADAATTNSSVLPIVREVLLSRWFYAGFATMAVGVILYFALLYMTDFTRALPVMGAIAYLVIPVYGYFVLREPITIPQCVGLFLLVAGIFLLRR